MASAPAASAALPAVSTEVDGQLSLGDALALEGQARALHAVDVQPWPDTAAAWIAALPRGAVFTADDLTAACGLPRGAGGVNNAVGAAIGAARRRRLIHAVGWDIAKRPECHGRPVRVWTRTAVAL